MPSPCKRCFAFKALRVPPAVLLAIQLTLRRFRGIYLMDAQEGVRGPLRIVRLRGEEEVLERTGIVCLNAAAVLV